MEFISPALGSHYCFLFLFLFISLAFQGHACVCIAEWSMIWVQVVFKLLEPLSSYDTLTDTSVG